MAEWPNAAVLKTVRLKGLRGSNPFPSANVTPHEQSAAKFFWKVRFSTSLFDTANTYLSCYYAYFQCLCCYNPYRLCTLQKMVHEVYSGRRKFSKKNRSGMLYASMQHKILRIMNKLYVEYFQVASQGIQLSLKNVQHSALSN